MKTVSKSEIQRYREHGAVVSSDKPKSPLPRSRKHGSPALPNDMTKVVDIITKNSKVGLDEMRLLVGGLTEAISNISLPEKGKGSRQVTFEVDRGSDGLIERVRAIETIS